MIEKFLWRRRKLRSVRVVEIVLGWNEVVIERKTSKISEGKGEELSLNAVVGDSLCYDTPLRSTVKL